MKAKTKNSSRKKDKSARHKSKWFKEIKPKQNEYSEIETNFHKKKFFVRLTPFLILFFTSLTFLSAQPNWNPKANFPASRVHAVGFSIGNYGYIGTGYGGGTDHNDLWEWDKSTNIWTQKASMGGFGRRGAVGFSIGTKGYIGTGVGGPGKMNDFWEWDQSTNTWTQKANVGGGLRDYAVGFSVGNYGYIGTGFTTNYAKDFWQYDPSTDTWTQKANFGGTARCYSVGFFILNKGYIGTGEDQVGNTNDFWEYNPSNDTWTQKANFAGTKRREAVGFSVGGLGYLGTGYDGGISNPSCKDFWEYNPGTDSWTQRPSFGGGPRMDAVGFSVGNCGYIGTGCLDLSKNPLNDYWEYCSNCTLSAAAVSTTATCSSNNGTATANPSGGTSPYTYQWSNGQTTQTISGLSAGTYTVTITDANTCAQSAVATITSSAGPSVTANSTATSCNGNGGSATATASGGNSPYTYQWSNGQTAQTATGLSASTYTVVVTDANGCTNATTINVTSTTGPNVSATSTPAHCYANGTATANPSGGTSPYTYQWSSGQTTQTITGLNAGNYTVVVADANGCTQSTVVNVTQSANVVSLSVSSQNVTTCNGGNNGAATANPSGGSSPYTYQWNNGQTTQTATGLTAGNYSVTVTDAYGCSAQQTVTITQPTAVAAAVFADPNIICAGYPAYMTASGGVSYSWNTGQTTASVTVYPTVTTTYTVWVTDANGCTGTTTMTIIVNNCSTGIATINSSSLQTSIYPNPFSETATLQITNGELRNMNLKIYDVIGKEMNVDIIRTPMAIGADSFVISRSGLPTGIYFYRIVSEGENIAVGKLVVQ
ncbi:MAG: T9SS type A sorting domain-containing protein [Bacteroidetes bacterium]|nr:T9SS type A sorting domain-containing protein [Bacteroidota bacterium]